jgi:hypothetical protein
VMVGCFCSFPELIKNQLIFKFTLSKPNYCSFVPTIFINGFELIDFLAL